MNFAFFDFDTDFDEMGKSHQKKVEKAEVCGWGGECLSLLCWRNGKDCDLHADTRKRRSQSVRKAGSEKSLFPDKFLLFGKALLLILFDD